MNNDTTLPPGLGQRQLLVVTGKGGVGKTAVTAALGRQLAAAGRKTLLLEVDPRENLHHLLGIAPSGGDIIRASTDGASADEHLYLQNLKPSAVVEWVVRRQVKIEALTKRVMASPVYERFVEGAPGLKELAVLGHALRIVRGDMNDAPAIDTVVLDAPATGHGLYMLTAPRLFVDAIESGPFADLAREVADFVDDPQRCGVVVVTVAEEMPVQESLELRQSLIERFGRQPDLLAVNALYPETPAVPESSGPAGEGDGDRARALELWRRRRQVNERELARLTASWQGPRVDLPLLPIDRGSRLASVLGDHMMRQLRES